MDIPPIRITKCAGADTSTVRRSAGHPHATAVGTSNARGSDSVTSAGVQASAGGAGGGVRSDAIKRVSVAVVMDILGAVEGSSCPGFASVALEFGSRPREQVLRSYDMLIGLGYPIRLASWGNFFADFSSAFDVVGSTR